MFPSFCPASFCLSFSLRHGTRYRKMGDRKMKGRERLNQATFRWKTALPITVGPVGVLHKSERACPSLCVTEYRSWIGTVRVDFERDHQLATAPWPHSSRCSRWHEAHLCDTGGRRPEIEPRNTPKTRRETREDLTTEFTEGHGMKRAKHDGKGFVHIRPLRNLVLLHFNLPCFSVPSVVQLFLSCLLVSFVVPPHFIPLKQEFAR